jgi:hypothetical protein
MMNRRRFFGLFGMAAGVKFIAPLAALIPEVKAVVPAPVVAAKGLSYADINAITMSYIIPEITDNYFRHSVLFDELRSKETARC